MTLVRTRFAPSPTGFLHVGGVRTALFAWLIAKQQTGKFILRIEDTDRKRLEPGSMEHIKDSLAWLDIGWDEGPDAGGPHAPYLQSERLDIYQSWAARLIAEGRAYADPYTPEEVQSFREAAQAAKQPFLFRNHRPINPPEWDGTTPLRFKSDPKSYQWHDEVMGDLSSGPEVIDDFILMKSDGYPTYNFAHIVDDADMEVTHVIRGQEFLSSMPNYLNLYEALGLDRPTFATMPHIMNEQGNKKLGKRDGAKDILEYRQDGYLPAAMRNFLASLGWNDGTEQELFTTEELINTFSLDRVQRSGARFDERRLLWMNGQFIRQLTIDELLVELEPFWSDAARQADSEYRRAVAVLAQDRLKVLTDITPLTEYFFNEPTADISLISSNKQLSKLAATELADLMQQSLLALERTEWNAEAIQSQLNSLLETTSQKPAVLFSLIRIAVTWAPFSPQLNDSLVLIGRERTLARMTRAIDLIRQA